jgi:hypothetical protein
MLAMNIESSKPVDTTKIGIYFGYVELDAPLSATTVTKAANNIPVPIRKK